MIVTVPDRVAARLRALAAVRGESVDDVATKLIEASLQLPHSAAAPACTDDGENLLEAFLGCGSSGNTTPATIQEMRRDLAARKVAAGTENI